MNIDYIIEIIKFIKKKDNTYIIYQFLNMKMSILLIIHYLTES